MADSRMVAAPIAEATLTDGTTIAVNDHVYLAPEHLGETYYIGRVMEFCGNSKRRGLQARIAWYNRPKDVISRKNHDPRLLVATMHSDLNPVSSIRGKCTVTHRHYIPAGKLEQYKLQDDHFYYHQLYDRYMQRVYDIVPCELVQNVPKDVQTALRERYQFIVVEQGKAADLTVARRTCCVCHDWCASVTSVRCAACQKNYHMACLNPPLLRKPSKGFAWQCAFCSRKEVLETPQPAHPPEKTNHSSPSGPRRPTRNAARTIVQKPEAPLPQIVTNGQKQPELKLRLQPNGVEKDRGEEPRMTNMWPFRYFGIHTDIHDILDIDDRIYPRARSRLGARYQADPIPELTNASSSNGEGPANHLSSPSKSQPPKLRAKRYEKRTRPRYRRRTEESPGLSRAPSEEEIQEGGPIERGTEATITPLFTPNRLSDEVLDKFMEQAKALPTLPLPGYSGDLMDRALLCLEHCNYDVDAALDEMRTVDESDFVHIVEWTPEEVEAFESAIKTYGHDLYHVGRMVPSKKHADVVRYFYQWKKTERYEPVYSEWTKVYKPTKKFKRFGNRDSGEEHNTMQIDSESELDSGEESDPTVIHASTHMRKSFQCANCQNTDSDIWRRLPTDIDRKRKYFRQVLCNECGEFWLKYGIMRKTSVERILQRGKPRGLKPNGSDAKRRRPNDISSTKIGFRKLKEDKRVVAVTYEPQPCAVCSTMEPFERLLTCHGCGMSVHGDCYGAHKSIKEAWNCDVCANKKNPTASYAYECILCTESRQTPWQPLKKTSSYNWVHILCAIFIPEVKFVNVATLQPAEYIGAIHRTRWNEICYICKKQKGACVICGDCSKPVHVQCALKSNFTVAFEVQSAKAPRSDVTTIRADLFHPNMPSGMMVPQVWCPNHDTSRYQLIHLSDRTKDSNVSCIRTYCSYYKQVEQGTTPAVRRYRAVLASAGHPYNVAIYNPSSIQSASPPTPPPGGIPTARSSTLATMPPPSPTTPVSSLDKSNRRSSTTTTTTTTTTVKAKTQQPRCSECPAEYSPYWWEVDASSNKKLCHRCYWRHKRDNSDMSVVSLIN